MDLHSFCESRVMTDSFCWFRRAGLAQAGGRWSGPSWWSDSSSSSCIFQSTIKVAFLGSITFSQVLELRSVRNEFTCSCSFLARLLVSGPRFVIFMLDGEWLSLEEARIAEMSSSHIHKA
jgi:hypothetical protein